jgi:DNA repair ATPase RecN
MSEEFKKLEPRVKTVEDAIRLLTELTLRHEERLDDHEQRLADHEQRLAEQESAERNLTAKMEALVDAQIRTEDALQRLTIKVDRLAGA